MSRVWDEGDLYVGYLKKRVKTGWTNAPRGTEYETRYGPYSTAGHAQGAISTETNSHWYQQHYETVETRIEKLIVTFETYDYATSKKERAAQLRREKKERATAKVQAAVDAFYAELDL